MMEHFYWQPLSMFCDCSRGSLQQLSKTQCEMIRATPSFQRYLYFFKIKMLSMVSFPIEKNEDIIYLLLYCIELEDF